MSNVISVATVADLALIDNNDADVVIVDDFQRTSGNPFEWQASGTANDGTVYDGATGVWKMLYSGPAHLEWWGHKTVAQGGGDIATGTNNLNDLLNLVATSSDFPVKALLATTPESEYYKCSVQIDFNDAVELCGEPYARFVFDSDADCGFYINSFGVTIRNVEAKYQPAAVLWRNDGKHGFVVRFKAKIQNSTASQWAGNGFHVFGNIGSGTNANSSEFLSCTAVLNFNGFYFDGPDANACVVSNAALMDNASWGVMDSSFLGNTFVGCIAELNGITTGSSTVVYNNGHLYAAKQEFVSGAIEPGVTTGWEASWTDQGFYPAPDSNRPQWVSSKDYTWGGDYAAIDPNNQSVFVSCYNEELVVNENIAGGRSLFVGGFGALKTTGASLGSDLGALQINNLKTRYLGHAVYGVEVGKSGTQGYDAGGMFIQYGNGHPHRWNWVPGLDVTGFNYARLDSAYYMFLIHQNVDPTNFGRSTGSLSFESVMFPSGILIQGLNGVKRFFFDSAVPSSGTFETGDTCLNSSPSAGEPVGWRCTASGTPGTWEAFGGDATRVSPLLPQYIDNAAALTGGLLAGDLYRDGDILMVVH